MNFLSLTWLNDALLTADHSYFGLLVPPFILFVISLIAIPPIRKLAIKLGYVDAPGGRKIHENPVPPVGGLVIFSLFLVAQTILFDFNLQIASLTTALLLLLITGIIDDKKPVPAGIKFAIHFAAAAIIVFPGDANLENMGNMLGLGDWHMGMFAPIFSVACAVYLINAINMMDGLDGLAGGKSLVIITWLIIAALMAGNAESALHMGLLAASLSGFLFYNMRHPLRDKACIFLGDNGSMALGLIIAWFCIHSTQNAQAALTPISVAWIIALPIIDAFGLFVMRIKEGRHPFSPDLRHFHHHFIHAGFPVGESTFMILSLGALLGAVGFSSYILNWPEYIMTALWIILWIGHALLVIKSEHFISILKKIFHIKQGRQS